MTQIGQIFVEKECLNKLNGLNKLMAEKRCANDIKTTQFIQSIQSIQFILLLSQTKPK
jgi:hypothetical protein